LRKSFNAFLFFLLISFTSFLNAEVVSGPYIQIDSIGTNAHLAKHSWILEDETHSPYSLLDSIEFYEGAFQANSNIPYMDFTSSTYWMRLKVENTSSEDHTFYVELARPLTNEVELYLFDENKQLLRHFSTGDEFPFYERPYLNRDFIFPLSFRAGSKRILLIRAKSDGEILKLPIHFWTIQSFTQFDSFENFFLGGYYGFIVLVVVLFGFFAYALRQKVYTYFVGYVLVLGLFQLSLDGLAYQLLWPSYPWMGNHAILIFAAISILALIAYADQFLGFRNTKGWFYKGYRMFYIIASLGLIFSFLSGRIYAITFPLLNGLSFLMLCYFFIGIYLNYKGKNQNKNDPFVTLAFAFLWFGAISFVLSNVDIIDNEFLASNALKLGSAAEITFLSIAMANRYRETQQEKILAQKEAFSRLEEINRLKDEQTDRLEQEVRERTAEISRQNLSLSAKNEEIIHSITYAKRLQDAILPSPRLLEAVFNKSAILYMPKDIVSGDFYWVEATKTHTYFAVADCTGHGVPGALVSVVGHNALNRCVNEMNMSNPGKILDRLKDLVEKAFSNSEVNDGMDICLCVWDNHETLYFAGAFNPLYLIRNKELIEIKGNKQPIGKFITEDPFTSHKIELQKGDCLFLFSDGYADQFGGERGKKLKYSGFKQYLFDALGQTDEALDEMLERRFLEWKGDEEQVDDVCVMYVQF
jgi:serine phosphatase RsbU (regulator of sigma subunit)